MLSMLSTQFHPHTQGVPFICQDSVWLSTLPSPPQGQPPSARPAIFASSRALTQSKHPCAYQFRRFCMIVYPYIIHLEQASAAAYRFAAEGSSCLTLLSLSTL
eukprot:1158961-Pelagomonas_calceolata.AAC.3